MADTPQPVDIGFGAKLQLGDAAAPGGTFTDTAYVRELGAFTRSRDDVETTHHQSAEREAEYIPGKRDSDNIDLTCSYDPQNASQIALIATFDDNQLHYFKYILNDLKNTGYYFQGYLNHVEVMPEIDNVRDLKISIKRSSIVIEFDDDNPLT